MGKALPTSPPPPNKGHVWMRTTRSSFLNEEIRRTVPTSSLQNNSTSNFAASYPWTVDLDLEVWRLQISTKTAKYQKTHPLGEQTLIHKRLTRGNMESMDWFVMDRCIRCSNRHVTQTSGRASPEVLASKRRNVLEKYTCCKILNFGNKLLMFRNHLLY